MNANENKIKFTKLNPEPTAKGSVPHYSICSPILFTQASHRCLPSVGIGSAWANWLAYNIGMARLLWSGKSLKLMLQHLQIIINKSFQTRFFFIERIQHSFEKMFYINNIIKTLFSFWFFNPISMCCFISILISDTIDLASIIF